MIHRATLHDVDFIVGLADEFSREYIGKPVNATKLAQVVRTCVADGVALYSDHGAIIGLPIVDLYFDQTNLVELGWFATDRSGIALLKHFEQAGAELGVTSIRMTTLHNSPQRIKAVLLRRGYVPLEQSWELKTGVE